MMKVAQTRESELTLYDGQQVRMVPNTPYFSLKYAVFEGNKISYVLNQKPYMRIFETGEKEFECNYNKMSISITEKDEVDELCKIILQHQNNADSINFENFFAKHFAENNQKEILDLVLNAHSKRLTENPAFDYTIDGIFGIRAEGEIYVKNPLNKKDFPWDRIKIIVSEMPRTKIILSRDVLWADSEVSRDIILDANMQKLITKISYLLSSEKKHDAMFMVQLPRKVQRWIDIGDMATTIKWNVPTEIKEEITVPKFYNYFPTPIAIVEILLQHAEIKENMTVLEPSAGQGHILEYLKNCHITCGELYLGNQLILKEKGYDVAFDDFMEFESPDTFDRIIMNPPFDEQKDIDHVTQAYTMLKPGGRLISVMANGITFRDNYKTVQLKELIEKNGYIINLPKESFKKSGTGINTVIVVIDKND
jgi:hypothetical protein